MAENKDIIKLSSFKKTIIVVDEIQEPGYEWDEKRNSRRNRLK